MSASGSDRSESDEPPTGPVSTVQPRAERKRRLGSRRTALFLVAVVAIAGASAGIWLATRKTSSAAPVTVSTEAVAVSTGTMKQTVATSGTIEPGNEADLDFAVSGTVTAVDVTSGSTVTKGETLATVDPAALEADVQSAEASLNSADDALSTDRSDSASASQIDSDDAAVTAAKTQLATAQTDRGDAALTSTISGTVASVDLTVGQQVSGSGGGSSGGQDADGSAASASSDGATSTGASADDAASSSSTSSSAQIEVIDTHSYTVSTTVDDTEVGQVKVGDQAVITPGSATTDVYGTVSSVGLIASDSSDVATFPVDIAVTGTPSGLYAGASATVSIVTEQLDNVVEVPTTAITYSGATADVTVVDGSRHVTTAVTTGVTSDGETQVTKGVTVGDKVLTRVVKFNAGSSGAKSLFGGTGGTGRSFGRGGGTGGFGGEGGFGGGTGGFGGDTGGFGGGAGG